jgi:cyclic pyranopterin phosphate synthase
MAFAQSSTPGSLIDQFGRRVTYLRISVTDRCDFRCVYCMAENMTFLPRSEILSLEEIAAIAAAFVDLGVDKIRITGGEPLVRKGVVDLMQELKRLPSLKELVLTTNGSLLCSMADAIKEAGVRRVNISLDTLKPERFRQLTRVGDLQTVLNGIDAALGAGFDRVKLNSVILKNRNDEEVADLVDFAIGKGVDISFIEEMPLGHVDGRDRAEQYYSSDEIRQDLERAFALLPSAEQTGGPSRYYHVKGTRTKVGFISPHSHNFCGSCNRVRLTAEGRLLLCLGNEHSVDLKQVVRAYPGNSELLRETIASAMSIKPERHEFELSEQPVIFRHMSVTGG